jgi:hypothetical protein
MPTMVSTAISGGAHLAHDIRIWIYAQDTTGILHEKRYFDDWKPSHKLPLARAKIGTPLAISFVEIEGRVIVGLIFSPTSPLLIVRAVSCTSIPTGISSA